MNVELLIRSRFYRVKGAKAVQQGPNAWEIRLPVDDPIVKKSRRGARIEDWDGAVFVVGDDEAEPAVATGASKTEIRVSVVVLEEP